MLAADELLPTGTLADGERAVPAHVTFDTEDGLIVAVHTLPARTPGLSACLNRPTSLWHVPEIGAAHKWYAILLSESGSFAGTSASIKNSFVVREHFERAAALSPKDATSRHLLGLWCFEVAKLSWIEQKAAAALFATPPTATFAEALDHFEHAERIEPGFYPKNLLLTAQALSRLGRADEAKAALAKCLAATPKSPEDEATLEEARKLKL